MFIASSPLLAANLFLFYGALTRGWRGLVGLLFFAIAGAIWFLGYVTVVHVNGGGAGAVSPLGPGFLLAVFLAGLVPSGVGVWFWREADRLKAMPPERRHMPRREAPWRSMSYRALMR